MVRCPLKLFTPLPQTLDKRSSPMIPVLWRVLYWSTQALTWCALGGRAPERGIGALARR